MAVRGINPFEKHLEKIFLALAAAGLTGVVAWQVAGGSGTVTVNREQVPLDQAYDRISSKAKTLQARMREADPKTPEALNHTVDVLGEFNKRMSGAVSPSPTIGYAPQGLPDTIVKQIGKPDGGEGGKYIIPQLPAATRPIAHAFMSTVSESEVTGIADLAKYMAAKAPYDKAAVSVETTIDPKAIRAALEADPDGAGPAPALLRSWWAGTEVVAVEMVRQEVKPDGTFGPETATPVLPGRKNFSAELHDPAISAQALSQIAFDAATSMDEILRPEWYKRAELGGNLVGDEWKPPALVAEGAQPAGNQQLDRDKKLLADLQQRLARTQKAHDTLQQQPAPKPSGGGGGAGFGGGGRKGGGGATGGGGGGGAPKPDAREQQLKDLERQIENLKKQIADVQGRISAAGGKVDDASGSKPVVRDADLSALLSSAEPITVWHHDIEAVRGSTYRYQLRIKLNNPLFNRPGQAAAADIAKAPTIEVPAGGWTDPVHVDDDVYCFFTNAMPPAVGVGGGTGLGSAQATLFYFTWGYWRSSQPVSLEPGDGMVARWTVPDESKIAAAPAAPNAAPPPPAAVPGGKGKPAAAGGGVAPPPAAPTPGAAPAGAVLATKEVVKERDAFLLDVLLDPVNRGSRSNRYVVMVRDIDKSIVLIDPEDHKTNQVFLRLIANAEQGKNQLKGMGTPVGSTPNNPAPPNNPPMQNPGRGGGGVGGG